MKSRRGRKETVNRSNPCLVRFPSGWLVNLCLIQRQRLGGCQIICKPHVRVHVFRFAARETFPGHHHRHRRFGDEVVGERSQQNTAGGRSITHHVQPNKKTDSLPFQRTSPSGAKDNERRFEAINLGNTSANVTFESLRVPQCQLTASVIIYFGLLQCITSTAIRTCSLVFLRNLMHVCEMPSIA